MKRALTIILILIGFCAVVHSQSYPVNDAVKKVTAEIRTFNWTPQAGWFEGEVTKIVVDEYDANGNPSMSTLHTRTMEVIEKTVYSQEGSITVKTTTNRDGVHTRTARIEAAEGLVTETVRLPDGTLSHKTVSELDGEGRIRELHYFNGDGLHIFDKVFAYTDEGDIARIDIFNPDGSYAAEVEIDYQSRDDQGNWLTRSEYYRHAFVGYRPRDYVTRTIEYK